jgi:hypothetical protein
MRAAGPARADAPTRRAPPRRRIRNTDNPKELPVNLPSTPMSAASGWRPVDPPRRPVLFINPKSGSGKAARADLAGRARAKDRSRHPGPGAGPDRADPWRGGGRSWWMPILVSATVQYFFRRLCAAS